MSRWVEAHTQGLVVRDSESHELEKLESAEAKGFLAPNGEPIRDWLRILIGPAPGVSVGDVIELVGLACLVVAFWLLLGMGAGFASLGAALFYEGQCYAPTTIKLPRRKVKSEQ